MKKVLVDTSVLIDFLRIKHKEQSLLFKLVRQKSELFISIITHAELFAGSNVWSDDKAKHELELLLSGLEVIVLNEDISKNAGQIRAQYRINLLDSIIAATAIEKGYLLATLNVKDFERIKGIKLAK